MVIFLETLGAILVAAKILKMTDISTFMCVLPLIVAAIVQFGTAWLEIKNKEAEMRRHESENNSQSE